MRFASKPFDVCRVSPRKRLAAALATIALCALTAACSDDDQAAATNTPGSTGHSVQLSADSNGASSFNAPTGSSSNSAANSLTIQTPAPSASDTGTALSAAAPLASPVIHTVN